MKKNSLLAKKLSGVSGVSVLVFLATGVAASLLVYSYLSSSGLIKADLNYPPPNTLNPASEIENENLVKSNSPNPPSGSISSGKLAEEGSFPETLKENCPDCNKMTAYVFESTAPDGEPPLIVHSKTAVGNLNASYLQGYQASDFQPAGSYLTNLKTSLPLTSSGKNGVFSIAILKANSSQSGYLSASDWLSFSQKEPGIALGSASQYFRGDKTWQTLNQEAVLGLKTSDAPTFAGLTLSGLSAGSILFTSSGGGITENNSGLFWDNANKRLGIGTSSPTASLSIKGGGGIYPLTISTSDGIQRVYVDETGNLHLSQNYPTRDSGILYVERESSGTGNNFTTHGIQLGGEGAGIGYNPISNFLFINEGRVLVERGGSVNVGILTVKTSGNVGINTSSPQTLFHIASTSPVAVTSAGAVGIGTTAPSVKLEVVGSTTEATFGSDRVTNGTFDTDSNWVGLDNTNWTWDSTNKEADHNTGNTTPLEQNIGASAGKVYSIVVEVKNRTAGTLMVYIGSATNNYVIGSTSGSYLFSNGTYTMVISAVDNGNLKFVPSTDFNGSVDNVSVKEVSPSLPIAKLSSSLGSATIEIRTGANHPSNLFIGQSGGAYIYNESGNRGLYNTGVGYEALKYSVHGWYNTAIGYQALQKTNSDSNTAVGYQALYSNTGGWTNTAVGYQALYSDTFGIRNTAVGAWSLTSNTSGAENSALGRDSMRYNTTGSFNVAVGAYSLQNNREGSYNVAVGMLAGVGASGQSYSYNTILGYRAGAALSTGSNNILLGYQAGDNLTTGTNNIIIGYNVDAPTATGSYQLNIGNLIYGDLSIGKIGIGTSAPTSTLDVRGPITTATTTKTTNYTLTDSDSVVFADASAGAITITLPPASSSTVGRVYYIYKTDNSANAVTVSGSGTDSVYGTASTSTQWKCIKVIGFTATSWIASVY